VIEWLTSTLGSRKKNLHLLSDRRLTDIVIQRLRSYRPIQSGLAVIGDTSSD
jgi:hypothetical protein